MKDKVRVVNKTGLSKDTKVYVGKKQIPLTKMFKVGIVYDSYNDVPKVHLELYVDSVDVIGEGIEAIAKVLNDNAERNT